MGRPRKANVDPLVVKAICDNLEIGMPIVLAAEAEGIPRSSVYEWIDKFPEFSGQITRAKAAGAKNLAIRAIAGGKGSHMAGWMLERRYREHYGPPKDDNASEVKVVIVNALEPRPKL